MKKLVVFFKTVILLERYFKKLTTLTNNDEQKTLKEFFSYDLNNEFEDIGNVRNTIDDFKLVKSFGKDDYIDKIIDFAY